MPVGIMVAFYIYWHVAAHCRLLDRLASRYIYYGVFARLIPCLRRTDGQGTEKSSTRLQTAGSDMKTTPLVSDTH